METHPVQNHKTQRGQSRCPIVVTLKAYEVYCHIWTPQKALVTGECRGGFGVGELIAYLYAANFPKEEWSERFNEAHNGMENLS